MRLFLKILTAACILSGVVIVGFVLGWFGSKSSTPEAKVQPVQAVESTSEPATPVIPASRTNESVSHNPSRATNTNPALSSTATTTTTTNAEWEDQLEAILGSDGEDTQKVKQLFAMFPQLPEDGQVEIAQHLSNLVSDQDYAPLGKLLTDPKQPEGVLDVLIADLLNRPNGTKLPLLLELARNAQHPKAVEAKDLLELYLEEDYGQNWDTWQAKTQQWLKDNPD